MDPVRLPRHCALSKENGFWVLNWSEEGAGLRATGQGSSRTHTVIAPAIGSHAVMEQEALRLARRFLLSKLPPGIRCRRGEMSIAEFVRIHFLPEFVAVKNLAGRAHYHSILKNVLSPEAWARIVGVHAAPFKAPSAARPGWPYLSNLRLAEVRTRHVRELLEAASANGYSAQTIRHIRSVVSTLFSFAKQELVFMGANPARTLSAPRSVLKSTPALNLSQMEQIIRAMRYPEKEMTLFALLTEMNVSEICGLQWKSVNLTGTQVNCEGEIIPPLTIAVRSRWYRGELASAKETRHRQIPIPDVLLSLLVLLNGRSRHRAPEDFVLTSRSGGPINAANITARRLASIGRELSIPYLTWQCMRRAQTAMKEAYGPQLQHLIAAAAVAKPDPRKGRENTHANESSKAAQKSPLDFPDNSSISSVRFKTDGVSIIGGSLLAN